MPITPPDISDPVAPPESHTVQDLFTLFGTRIATDVNAIEAAVNALNAAQGNLANLPTQHKVTLTGAIAELHTLINSVKNSAIDLSTVQSLVNAARDQIVNGAGAAYDTLQELAAEIKENDGILETLLSGLNKAVRTDISQPFTSEEKQRGRDNIDAVSQQQLTDAVNGIPNTGYQFDPTASYNAKRAQAAAA